MIDCAATFPGHELYDLGAAIRSIEWELEKWGHRVVMMGESDDPGEVTARAYVQHLRRRGVPAVRAYFDGECLVAEIAEPAGHG